MVSTANNKVETFTGKCSWFGGVHDTGVKFDENLALYETVDGAPKGLFLDRQPPGTTGTARRLNTNTYYIATRWSYNVTPKEWLKKIKVKVTNHKGESVFC